MSFKIFSNEKAVSPVVATLVLVVVAIIGAAAVGSILGVFSNDVSNKANAGDTAGAVSMEIVVAGSTTVQPVSENIAKEYMAKNPGVKVTVSGGGSGAGIDGAGLGSIDIGAASKYLEDTDKTKFPELEEHVIGGSAVVMITNKAYPANISTSVTPADAYTLYTSEANNTVWNTASGVKAVQRSESSGTEETFAKWASNGIAKDLDGATDHDNVTQINAIGNQGVLDKVASTDYAVGFVDYGFAKKSNDVIIIEITGYPAISESGLKSAVKDLMAGKHSTAYYPNDKDTGLCRPLVYLTNGQSPAVVGDYINFASSPAAISCFTDAGYWSITELQ
jgi:phosphate transport system substrate-binding protein